MAPLPTFGLDPIAWRVLTLEPLIAGFCLLVLRLPLSITGVIALFAGIAIVASQIGQARMRAADFMHRVPSTLLGAGAGAAKPTRVLYIPGLGEALIYPKPSRPGQRPLLLYRWLWDTPGASPLPARMIEPPAGWHIDLGSPAYVASVLDAIEAELLGKPHARLLVVGNSRGAGVLLYALTYAGLQRPKLRAVLGQIVGAVFLVGPFDSIEQTLGHRYGRWAEWLATKDPWLAVAHGEPHRFEWLARTFPFANRFDGPGRFPLKDMGKWTAEIPLPFSVLFVTSKADTALRPAAVRAAHDAVRVGVDKKKMLLELTAAPHSLLWADDIDLLAIRHACDQTFV